MGLLVIKDRVRGVHPHGRHLAQVSHAHQRGRVACTARSLLSTLSTLGCTRLGWAQHTGHWRRSSIQDLGTGLRM